MICLSLESRYPRLLCWLLLSLMVLDGIWACSIVWQAINANPAQMHRHWFLLGTSAHTVAPFVALVAVIMGRHEFALYYIAFKCAALLHIGGQIVGCCANHRPVNSLSAMVQVMWPTLIALVAWGYYRARNSESAQQ